MMVGSRSRKMVDGDLKIYEIFLIWIGLRCDVWWLVGWVDHVWLSCVMLELIGLILVWLFDVVRFLCFFLSWMLCKKIFPNETVYGFGKWIHWFSKIFFECFLNTWPCISFGYWFELENEWERGFMFWLKKGEWRNGVNKWAENLFGREWTNGITRF